MGQWPSELGSPGAACSETSVLPPGKMTALRQDDEGEERKSSEDSEDGNEDARFNTVRTIVFAH